jgi:site-specific recombinase XerD
MTRKQALKKFQEQMVLKGYSTATKKTYIIHVRKFMEFSKKKLADVDLEDAREFLLYSINERKLTPVYVRSVRAGIKLLYEGVLEKEWSSKLVPRIRAKKKLPVVLTKEEISQIFKSVKRFKYLVIFITAYSAGLRIGEVSRLRVCDIKSDTGQIYISKSKSGEYEDRYAILGEYNLKYLRKYYLQYKPEYWLFTGQNPSNHISKSTIHDVFKKAVKDSGIDKNPSMHSLRHSFATHLIEQGTNILKLKDLLGHSDIYATIRYVHLARKDVFNVKSPFDKLAGESK